MYNVNSKEWSSAPQIKQARSRQSSCSLQKFTYIFGGKGVPGFFADRQCLSSIERIDMEALTTGRWFVVWEMLTVNNQQAISPRDDAAITPIDESKILIFGGENDVDKSDGYIFDVESNSISKAFDEQGLETVSWSN